MLILAPSGRDGADCERILAASGLPGLRCPDLQALCREMRKAAGALLLAEEVMDQAAARACMAKHLRSQPPWSDLPVILLTRGQPDAPATQALMEALGNVMLLEHPAPPATLVSAVRAALRARQRQYQLRDKLAAERERAEEALRQGESQFREAFAHAPVGMVINSLEGGFLYVNEAYCRIVGYSAEELQRPGFKFQDITHPEDVGHNIEEMQRLIAGEIPAFFLEKRYIRKDGESVWVRVSSSLRRDAQGRPAHTVGIVEDITARKAAEAALRQSEERARRQLAELEFIYAHAPIGLAVLDRDLRFVRINRTLAEINGFTPEAHIGRTVGEIVPDLEDQAEAVLRRILETGEPVHDVEVVGETPAHPGEIRVWRESFLPLHGEDGEILGISAVCHDITERKRAEAALRRQNDRLALLSEAAGHLLQTESQEDLVGAIFRKLAAPLGLDAYFNFLVEEGKEELRLDSFAGIPERVARLIGRLEYGEAVCGVVARQRQAIHVSNVQQSSDPRTELIRRHGMRAYSCHPLIARGRLLGTLSFATRRRDAFAPDELAFLRTVCHYVALATDRLELEQELRRNMEQLANANAALGEADQRKDEFLAMLAHELRNPLAPIRNAVQVLRMLGAGEPRLERQRELIDRQVNHMVRLVDDLLDVSRITRGKISLKKERVDLADVLARAVEATQPLIESRRHFFELCLPEERLQVEADPVRLAQVVANLLNNAAKYTDEGGRIGLIVEHHDGNEALVQVHDNGMGIPTEVLPRIFDLFSQAERTLDRTQGGLGIGLYLVRRLVEMHGGSIQAWSPGPGMGSLFVIRLPLAAVEPPPAELEAGPRAAPGVAAAEGGRRVLVVDDNLDAANSLAELLNIWGQRVRVAHDGPSAVEAALEFLPDVVLLDIGLPGMNGYEVARRLRQEERLRGTLLVAVTGYGQEEDRREAFSAGFDHHFTKPVSAERLLRLLELTPSR